MNFTGYVSGLGISEVIQQLFNIQTQLKGGFWHDEIQRKYANDYDEIVFEVNKLNPILGTIDFVLKDLRNIPVTEHLSTCKQVQSIAKNAIQISKDVLGSSTPQVL